MTCALCKADYPASYMDIHLKKEHNIEEDPSLGPKVQTYIARGPLVRSMHGSVRRKLTLHPGYNPNTFV